MAMLGTSTKRPNGPGGDEVDSVKCKWVKEIETMGELSLAFVEPQPCSRPLGLTDAMRDHMAANLPLPATQYVNFWQFTLAAFLDHRRAPHGWLAAFGQAFPAKVAAPPAAGARHTPTFS